jgi:hypothetical protein
MPVQLLIDAVERRLSVHESIRVRVTLRNDSPVALNIPSLEDRTDAYSFEFQDDSGALVRRVNGITGQVMMSQGRVDWARSIESLSPGALWQEEFDLGQLHYLLPAGRYGLLLRLRAPAPDPIEVLSNSVALEVLPEPVRSVRVWRDDPVLDGLILAIDGERQYLRQYSAGHPLAAWYARAIAESGAHSGAHSEAGSAAHSGESVYARADFFDPSSFDAFEERVLLRREGRQLRIETYRSGTAIASGQPVELPPGRTLIEGAYRDSERRTHLFLSAPGLIECYRVDADRLSLRFSRPAAAPATLCVIGGELHLLEQSGRALLHHRIASDGTVQASRTLFISALKPVSIRIDPVRRLVLACFADLPHGRSLSLLAVSLDEGAPPQIRHWADPIVGAEMREMAMDIDRAGRMHLVIATNRGRLLYWADSRGPSLVARKPGRFHPFLVTVRKPYLGFLDAGGVYRFVELQGRHGRPGVKDYARLGER